MKRINNLYEQVYSIENLELADKYARRGKHNYGIKKHDLHREEDNKKLRELFIKGNYKTSKYTVFKIYEPKERTIYRLPYYPDRIAHWCIMLIMERMWTNIFIKHTYSCIKGRGIHKLVKDLKKDLQNNAEDTKYCLKLDIRKFYPSIDHDILKQIIRRKIKDKQLLNLLDNIIDSTSGVPIGNYLSQFFANLYLTYFDHWLLEEVKIKHYYRYADDIVILSDNKEFLHKVLILIKLYLKYKLKLTLKPNYQIYPVDSRGIDFVGYIFRHNYILVRKKIKLKLLQCIANYVNSSKTTDNLQKLNKQLIAYFGWLKYCNSKHLLQKIELITGIHYSNWNGYDSKISKYYDKNIQIVETASYKKYYKIHFKYKNKSISVKSTNKHLKYLLDNNKLPINIKLKKKYGNSKKNKFNNIS